MGSELTPEARRLVEELISGKGLAELAPRDDPARQEIIRHLESLLAGKKSLPGAMSSGSASTSASASMPPARTSSRIESMSAKGGGSNSPNAAILFTDGASRGNPGPAAIGFILQDPTGYELAAEGEPIGTTTNNVAEYQALLAGLRRAR